MDLRRWTAFAAMTLPLFGAVLVMAAGLGLHGHFSDNEPPHCCGSSDLKLPAPPGDRVPSTGALRPEIYAQRIRYVAAGQFQVATIFAAIGFGLALAVPLAFGNTQHGRTSYAIAAVTLGITAALTFIGTTTSPALHALLELTVEHEFASIETFRILLEQLTSVAATVLVVTASLLLFPVSGNLETRLRTTAERHTALSYLLALGTALLAGDVLLKRAAGQWSLSYFVDPDCAVLRELVDGIVSGWAVYDSLFLAATYIPAAVVLRGRLARYASEVDVQPPPAWFDKTWLTISPLQEISRLIAILGPFLVGQASDIANLLK